MPAQAQGTVSEQEHGAARDTAQTQNIYHLPRQFSNRRDARTIRTQRQLGKGCDAGRIAVDRHRRRSFAKTMCVMTRKLKIMVHPVEPMTAT
jgi:hypothetical protein